MGNKNSKLSSEIVQKLTKDTYCEYTFCSTFVCVIFCFHQLCLQILAKPAFSLVLVIHALGSILVTHNQSLLNHLLILAVIICFFFKK